MAATGNAAVEIVIALRAVAAAGSDHDAAAAIDRDGLNAGAVNDVAAIIVISAVLDAGLVVVGARARNAATLQFEQAAAAGDVDRLAAIGLEARTVVVAAGASQDPDDIGRNKLVGIRDDAHRAAIDFTTVQGVICATGLEAEGTGSAGSGHRLGAG